MNITDAQAKPNRSAKIDAIINPTSLIMSVAGPDNGLSLFNTPAQASRDCPIHSMSISALAKLSNQHAGNMASCCCHNSRHKEVRGSNVAQYEREHSKQCFNYASCSHFHPGGLESSMATTPMQIVPLTQVCQNCKHVAQGASFSGAPTTVSPSMSPIETVRPSSLGLLQKLTTQQHKIESDALSIVDLATGPLSIQQNKWLLSSTSPYYMTAYQVKEADAEMTDAEKPNWQQTMYDRWLKSNAILPEVDQQDICNENAYFKDPKIVAHRHQHHPEYVQSSYLRLREQEEMMTLSNYLDPRENMGWNNGGRTQELQMAQFYRQFAVEKISELHSKKGYKNESLFVACSIFDRYLHSIGWQNFPRERTCELATICILMAAKLEQPISPSFSRMIGLLQEQEQKTMTKKSLAELEAQILMELKFEFNYPNPMASMERYLRILGYDFNRTVYDMSFQLCKFQLNDSKFLDFRPSQMAVCCILLAVNIYERDVQKVRISQLSEVKITDDSNLFGDQVHILEGQLNGRQTPLLKFNTRIWNNPRVATLTGYTMEMIREPLYQLAVFVQDNLNPNRLEGFDLEAIRTLPNLE